MKSLKGEITEWQAAVWSDRGKGENRALWFALSVFAGEPVMITSLLCRWISEGSAEVSSVAVPA